MIAADEVLRGRRGRGHGSRVGARLHRRRHRDGRAARRALPRAHRPVEKLEGQRAVPPTFLIIEWRSKQAADAFYRSEEYRAYRERRRSGARNEFVLVAGEDFAGLARLSD